MNSKWVSGSGSSIDASDQASDSGGGFQHGAGAGMSARNLCHARAPDPAGFNNNENDNNDDDINVNIYEQEYE